MNLIITSRNDTANFAKSAQQALSEFRANPKSGFADVVNRTDLWKSSAQIGLELRKSFQNIFWFGVGGSVLGAQVIAEVFNLQGTYFCDTVDPVAVDRMIEKADLKNSLSKTLFVLASKSGSTIETLAAWDYISLKFPEIKSAQVLVLTESANNALGILATEKAYRILPVPSDIGGRFSVLGPNGMFLAAFAGLDIEQFRLGAAKALSNDAQVTEVAAECLASWQREEFVSLMWIYNSALKPIGAWWVQLWAESLAKKENLAGGPSRRVSTPITALGPCDQHSLLQLLMEGEKDKFVFFVRVNQSERHETKLTKGHTKVTEILVGKSLGELLAAEASATEEALNQVGVKTLRLTLQQVNEHELGYFFMFWQLVVAVLGQSLNIDSFNQPGVELGKILTKKQLAENSR